MAGPMSGSPQRCTLSGATMGTRYSAVIFPPPDVDLDLLSVALQDAVDAVDDQMSTWKPESHLMRFNRSPTGVWFDLPPQLESVLADAFEIGRQSSDAFDAGVGDLVAAWGFGVAQVPDPKAIATACKSRHVPARLAVELDRERHRARKACDVSLDLSGIAKGYGVDELSRVLEEHDVGHYLASIDGEVRAAGGKPDGSAWRVAVEAPVIGRREPLGTIDIWSGALATSGDYRQVIVLDGVRHSHTMNPTERRPAVRGLTSVTVRAPTCIEADAWATAFMVQGAKAGARLAEAIGLEVFFVAADE